MFRTVDVGYGTPYSLILDPSAEFQAGQVAQLTVIGNQRMATVSNGLAPFGVIDDIRTKSFTSNAWNETVITQATGVPGPNNTIITPIDILVPLKHPNILESTFISSDVDVLLNPVNGNVTFPAGTALNFDLTGSGIPNAIRTIVNYTYNVPNILGDDSTAGTGMVTVWYQRMIFQTDQFETNQVYPTNAPMFVNESGKFTSRKPSDKHPSVGMVMATPSPLQPMLEILWF